MAFMEAQVIGFCSKTQKEHFEGLFFQDLKLTDFRLLELFYIAVGVKSHGE